MGLRIGSEPLNRGAWFDGGDGNGYVPVTVPLFSLWLIEQHELDRASRSGAHDLTRDSYAHYLFAEVERVGPDHRRGSVFGSVISGTGPWIVDGRPWHELQNPNYRTSILINLREQRRSIVTFDGVGIWQVVGFDRPSGSDPLIFELRREAAVSFVTTHSLLFREDLSFMHDDSLRGEVRKMIVDVEGWIAAGDKWDAVMKTAADICDRLLLDRILRRDHEGTSPPRQVRTTDVRRWDLSQRIDEAVRLGEIFNKSLLFHSLHMTRALGNLHHGGSAQAQDIAPGPHDAMAGYATVKNLVQKFSAK